MAHREWPLKCDMASSYLPRMKTVQYCTFLWVHIYCVLILHCIPGISGIISRIHPANVRSPRDLSARLACPDWSTYRREVVIRGFLLKKIKSRWNFYCQFPAAPAPPPAAPARQPWWPPLPPRPPPARCQRRRGRTPVSRGPPRPAPWQ